VTIYLQGKAMRTARDGLSELTSRRPMQVPDASLPGRRCRWGPDRRGRCCLCRRRVEESSKEKE